MAISPRMRAMRRLSWLSCLPCAFVLIGCQRNEYDISLKATPEGMERTVKFRQNASDENSESGQQAEKPLGKPSGPVVAKLAEIYDAQPPTQAGKRVTFAAKVFSGKMPQDVGGSGRYVRFESPLGAAVGYFERFRGNDDLHAQIEDRPKAVDQLTDLGIGWLATEFGNEPGWEELKKFLDTTLRRDLQNASLFAWSAATLDMAVSTKDEVRAAEVVLRVAQYFVERDYVAYEDLPAIQRAVDDSQRGNTAGVIALAHKIVAAKVATTQPSIPPEKLVAFILDERRAPESWKTYFEQTEYFRQKRAKLQAEAEKTPGDSTPADEAATEPQEREQSWQKDVLAELFLTAFLPTFQLGGMDKVNVSLAADHRPVLTNGAWDSEEKRVQWSAAVDVPNDGRPLPLDWPAFAYAVWDEPNTDAQVQMFGSTAVTGRDLVEYCVWYQSLSADERQQWDNFTATLNADPASREKLQAFRFAGEPAKQKSGHPIAAQAINVLARALACPTE